MITRNDLYVLRSSPRFIKTAGGDSVPEKVLGGAGDVARETNELAEFHTPTTLWPRVGKGALIGSGIMMLGDLLKPHDEDESRFLRMIRAGLLGAALGGTAGAGYDYINKAFGEPSVYNSHKNIGPDSFFITDKPEDSSFNPPNTDADKPFQVFHLSSAGDRLKGLGDNDYAYRAANQFLSTHDPENTGFLPDKEHNRVYYYRKDPTSGKIDFVRDEASGKILYTTIRSPKKSWYEDLSDTVGSWFSKGGKK